MGDMAGGKLLEQNKGIFSEVILGTQPNKVDNYEVLEKSKREKVSQIEISLLQVQVSKTEEENREALQNFNNNFKEKLISLGIDGDNPTIDTLVNACEDPDISSEVLNRRLNFRDEFFDATTNVAQSMINASFDNSYLYKDDYATLREAVVNSNFNIIDNVLALNTDPGCLNGIGIYISNRLLTDKSLIDAVDAFGKGNIMLGRNLFARVEHTAPAHEVAMVMQAFDQEVANKSMQGLVDAVVENGNRFVETMRSMKDEERLEEEARLRMAQEEAEKAREIKLESLFGEFANSLFHFSEHEIQLKNQEYVESFRKKFGGIEGKGVLDNIVKLHEGLRKLLRDYAGADLDKLSMSDFPYPSFSGNEINALLDVVPGVRESMFALDDIVGSKEFSVDPLSLTSIFATKNIQIGDRSVISPFIANREAFDNDPSLASLSMWVALAVMINTNQPVLSENGCTFGLTIIRDLANFEKKRIEKYDKEAIAVAGPNATRQDVYTHFGTICLGDAELAKLILDKSNIIPDELLHDNLKTVKVILSNGEESNLRDAIQQKDQGFTFPTSEKDVFSGLYSAIKLAAQAALVLDSKFPLVINDISNEAATVNEWWGKSKMEKIVENYKAESKSGVEMTEDQLVDLTLGLIVASSGLEPFYNGFSLSVLSDKTRQMRDKVTDEYLKTLNSILAKVATVLPSSALQKLRGRLASESVVGTVLPEAAKGDVQKALSIKADAVRKNIGRETTFSPGLQPNFTSGPLPTADNRFPPKGDKRAYILQRTKVTL